MRLNKFIATYADTSRRKADELIKDGHVIVNRVPAHHGITVTESDTVIVDGKRINPIQRPTITVMLNKPVGYVCSQYGQGSQTVYELLQKRFQQLNIAGRLDKDSTGLVIFTNDGTLLNELTHPSNNKIKIYEVKTSTPLSTHSIKKLRAGVDIGDTRLSALEAVPLPIKNNKEHCYTVLMQEGRNRQIRRSFEAVGKPITSLHRIKLGDYELGNLASGKFKIL